MAQDLALVGHIFNLIVSETFLRHEVLQIGHSHLLIKHFLHHGSNLIDFDDGACKVSLSLPNVECIANLSRDEVAKHGLLLSLHAPVAENLTTQMRVILQKFTQVDLAEHTLEVLGREFFFVTVAIFLGLTVVLNHLESGDEVSIVELESSV